MVEAYVQIFPRPRLNAAPATRRGSSGPDIRFGSFSTEGTEFS